MWCRARQDAVNPNQTGTKAAAHYRLTVGAGATATSSGCGLTPCRIRDPFGDGFDQVIAERRHEADEFYHAITPAGIGADAANVMRQALAGMLWGKQYFFSTPTNGSRNTAPIRCDRPHARSATASGST